MGVFKGEEVDEGGSKAAILGFATALGRGRARYFSGPAQALEKSGFSPGIRGIAAVSAEGDGVVRAAVERGRRPVLRIT
ncbi:hypothetical protein BK635_05780 [Pseudomonas chlororaphis]|nr:hypothetical protein BK635_05780 [Pseudomonas chlororaphis]